MPNNSFNYLANVQTIEHSVASDIIRMDYYDRMKAVNSILQNKRLNSSFPVLYVEFGICNICCNMMFQWMSPMQIEDHFLNLTHIHEGCAYCEENKFYESLTPLLDLYEYSSPEELESWSTTDPRHPIGKLTPRSIFIMRTCISAFGDDKMANILGSMEYSDFLETAYWKVISYHVKLSANFLCEKCGSRNNLVSHHKTYKRHGYEHLYWNEDLICLCEKCHSVEHKKSRK